VIPSELASLALGLVLGIATGAAIVVISGSRHPTHEIRLTVTRDAVPRRASTLAADAFAGLHDGPAPGGPGDRRSIDRDMPITRTIVRSPGVAPSTARPFESPAARPLESPATAPFASPAAVAIAIEPEPDPLLAELALPLDPPSLQLVLAGDHRAMRRLLDAVAAPDGDSRRAWEELLTGFVESVRERSIDLGLVDLPMGNPFWDTFTVDQCREIVVALASMGRRFDGIEGWADGVVPTYRDLSQALADSGIEPRRVRAWPNSAEIAELFRGARVAAGEGIARWAPTLEPAALQAFLAERATRLEPLWAVWDVVRRAVGADDAAGHPIGDPAGG